MPMPNTQTAESPNARGGFCVLRGRSERPSKLVTNATGVYLQLDHLPA